MSAGTPWPAKNDGRVVVRTLLQAGFTPRAGDAKIAKYVQEYSSKLAGSPSYNNTSVVLFTELVKLVLALGMYRRYDGDAQKLKSDVLMARNTSASKSL